MGDAALTPGVLSNRVTSALAISATRAFTPKEVMVSVLHGERVYLAEAPARVLIEPMPSCVSIWQQATRVRDSLVDARRSHPADSAATDRAFHLADDADAAVRQCYADHVPADPRFATLTQQVASIVRRLQP